MRFFKTPFLFLRIRFRQRIVLSSVIPVLLSCLTCVGIALLEPNFNVIGANGLFDRLVNLMTVCGGFFVASLAIILTSNQNSLASTFVGTNVPTLDTDGEPLTRRRFLAILFGYLGFLSLIVAGITTGVSLIGQSSNFDTLSLYYVIAKYGSIFVVIFLVTNVFANSLVGLHYLIDRLNRSDQTSNFSKDLPK